MTQKGEPEKTTDFLAGNACLTAHVLEADTGKPGTGKKIVLIRIDGSREALMKTDSTDADGRLSSPLLTTNEAVAGDYRLSFETKSEFFKTISVDFHIADPKAHYHVPLVVSSFGYSTYRGAPPHRNPIDGSAQKQSLTVAETGEAPPPAAGGAGITVHIIDIARGMGAGGMRVVLCNPNGERINDLTTTAEGRTAKWLAPAGELEQGRYELTFALGPYFAACGFPVGERPFFPLARVGFHISDPDVHHHIPLLAAPWGYSCYRGS